MFRIGGQKIPPKTLLLFVSDAVLIVLGLLLATQLRSVLAPLDVSRLHVPATLFRFGIVVLVCLWAMYYNSLYDFQVIRRRSEIFVHLLRGLGTACLALAVIYYVNPELSLGRGIAALATLLITILILGWRLLLDSTGFLPSGQKRVLIVGTGPVGISLAREIGTQPELNLKVIGFLDEKGEDIGKSLVNPRIIGATSQMESIVARSSIDSVVLSLAERRGHMPVRELLHLKFAGVAVEDAHSFYEKLTGRILLDHFSPSWLILSDGFRKPAFTVAAKRALDIVVSLCALILTLPLLAAIAVAIWLETGRPILFAQKRTGLRGREFEILKFRSMYQNAEQTGPSWAATDDKRITRVGRWLRKFRLDEIPQLFNVLRGEMSLAGPRPERPYFCGLLEPHIPFFSLRHSVRPGITGWAQIKYHYGSSIEEAKIKLEYDLFYIKHM